MPRRWRALELAEGDLAVVNHLILGMFHGCPCLGDTVDHLRRLVERGVDALVAHAHPFFIVGVIETDEGYRVIAFTEGE